MTLNHTYCSLYFVQKKVVTHCEIGQEIPGNHNDRYSNKCWINSIRICISRNYSAGNLNKRKLPAAITPGPLERTLGPSCWINKRLPWNGLGYARVHTPGDTPDQHISLQSLQWMISCWFKVIRKFFLKHNRSFRWHLGDYEKHIFFHLKACERRNFDFCVFLRMCSGSVKNRFI